MLFRESETIELKDIPLVPVRLSVFTLTGLNLCPLAG